GHVLEPGAYYVATVHRASNTDDAATLRALFEAFGGLKWRVVLPLHPRTREAMAAAGVTPASNVRIVDPVGYFEMVALERNARAVLTDSGGVQREAYFLGVPCVTLRTESEWPETAADGWNVLAGAAPDAIVRAAQRSRSPVSPRPA